MSFLIRLHYLPVRDTIAAIFSKTNHSLRKHSRGETDFRSPFDVYGIWEVPTACHGPSFALQDHVRP